MIEVSCNRVFVKLRAKYYFSILMFCTIILNFEVSVSILVQGEIYFLLLCSVRFTSHYSHLLKNDNF